MIIFSAFVSDFLFHFAVIVLFSAYLRYLLTSRDNTFIWISLVAALIITFINHRYYPFLILRQPSRQQIIEGVVQHQSGSI
jgi:hypothetical protein